MYPLGKGGVLDYSEFNWLLFFKFLNVEAEIIDMGPVFCLKDVFSAINLSPESCVSNRSQTLCCVFSSIPFKIFLT